MSENETAVIRWNYGDPSLGACKETIEGGNHFRYWVQNGKSANRCAPSVTFLMGTLIILWSNSGAVFMAESYEMPIAQQHDIVPNGYLLPTPHSLSLLIPPRRYNLGRDWLVGNATNQTSLIPTLSLTNTSTISGSRSYGGYTYLTNVTYVSGLLQNTSVGINHNGSVPVPGDNAVDGLVAVLGVTITQRPAASSSSRCVNLFSLSVGDFSIYNVSACSASWTVTPSILGLVLLPALFLAFPSS